MRQRWVMVTWALGPLAMGACSEDRHFSESSGGVAATQGGVGGAVASGGRASGSGGATNARGGSPSNSGGTADGNGGSDGPGGAGFDGTGGSVSEGGAPDGGVGGTVGAGGKASGGTATSGGASNGGKTSTGGATSGGTTSSGGKSTAGGATGSGGATKGGATGSGGTTGSGGATGTGGVTTCSTDQTLCASTGCKDLTSDAKNCGSCGHDCGALSACTNSRCQPAPIITGLTNAQGMDVSAKGVFFTTSNTIQYCTKPATCAATQQQIGTPGAASTLAVTKTLTTDVVGFYGRNAASDKYAGYHTCPVSGCGTVSLANPGPSGAVTGLIGVDTELYYQSSGSSDASTSVIVRMTGNADGTQGTKLTIGDRAAAGKRIAVDAQYVYYVRIDANSLSNVVACSRATGCSAYTSLETGDPTNFAAYGGTLYYQNGIQLKRCTATSATVTSVASLPSAYDKDMLVDGTNIYWLTANSVLYCALPTCVGGVKTLASGLASPTTLRMDAGSLYWLIPSDSTSATGGIYRIAKP